MKIRKIAVFMSGPSRYVDLVHRNLEQRLSGVAVDYFYHLWTEDLGNKIRGGYSADLSYILAHPSTKVMVHHKPYSLDFYRGRFGVHVNTHSTANAIIGMFLGISQLCAIFSQLPDRGEYSHILRIRTDCVILNSGFWELLQSHADSVLVSSDSATPPKGWVCDHMMFAPASLFLNVYRFNAIDEVYDAIERGQRNPEKTLFEMLKERVSASHQVVGSLTRYVDYQIVYSPPRKTDSAWMRALIDAGRMRELFLETDTFRRLDEDLACVMDQSENWRPTGDPYGNKFKNKLSVLVRRIKGLFL